MSAIQKFQTLHWPTVGETIPLQLWIQENLEAFIEEAIEASLSRRNQQSSPPNLREAIRYSLLAPGKRIRPRLAIACGQMLQIPPLAALAAGAAIEMIHCFTLIHDDLPCMDNDDFRRGRPSNHKVYGEALALLAGDSLMACALDTLLLSRRSVPADHLLNAFDRFSWACGARGVMGGQAQEFLLTPQATRQQLETMFAGKTGALFSASLEIPMAMAGLSDETREGKVIARFAAELGYAFQVADDIEDAEAPGSRESEKPQSILFYLSAKQAAQETHLRLLRASDELKLCFGSKAWALNAIAQEVLQKLQKQGQNRE
jgi:geranylgeranyl diphosphate synthase type II